MDFNLKVECVNKREDVAKAFNKNKRTLYTLSAIYNRKGRRAGLISAGEQVPYAVFACRVIRNTPKEFWEFFLNDNNFRNFDIVKEGL